MRVLIDTNIVMDALTEREPFAEKSKEAIRIFSENKAEGFLAAHTVTNLFYLLRHDFSLDERRKVLLNLFDIFDIEHIDSEKLRSALQKEAYKDFEDCLQVECAKAVHADYIVSRNIKDFENSPVPCIDPIAFCAIFDTV